MPDLQGAGPPHAAILGICRSSGENACMTNAHTHCPMHGAPTLQGTLNTLVYDVSPGALHMLNRPCKSSMQAAVEAPLSCMALGRGAMQC